MKLILTRHGKTKENVARVILGQNPGELSDEGVQKATELKKKIDHFNVDIVYSSDLKRCVDTANILTSSMNCEIKFDPRLREINFGEHQGKPYSVVKSHHISQMDLPFPNGESNNQLIKRVIDSINDMLRYHHNKTILVVSHSGPISVITASVSHTSFADTIDDEADHNDILILKIDKPLDYPR